MKVEPMIPRMYLPTLAFVFATVFSALQCSAQNTRQEIPVADIEINKDNFSAWINHISPTHSELKFLEIPWLSTFEQGILTGDKQGKPVLLWTMNGHPLGCT